MAKLHLFCRTLDALGLAHALILQLHVNHLWGFIPACKCLGCDLGRLAFLRR
jgi:hypothetical protein